MTHAALFNVRLVLFRNDGWAVIFEVSLWVIGISTKTQLAHKSVLPLFFSSENIFCLMKWSVSHCKTLSLRSGQALKPKFGLRVLYDTSPGLVALKTSQRMCDVVPVGYRVSNRTSLFFCKFLVCFNLKLSLNKLSCTPYHVALRHGVAHFVRRYQSNKSWAHM